jgi:predicted secreted protein
MQLFTMFAVYFIFWWITLFAVLPFGLKTQQEDNNVVAGSIESAPANFRGLRLFIVTSIVAGIVYAIWYFVTVKLGLNFDSIPKFYPDFEKK